MAAAPRPLRPRRGADLAIGARRRSIRPWSTCASGCSAACWWRGSGRTSWGAARRARCCPPWPSRGRARGGGRAGRHPLGRRAAHAARQPGGRAGQPAARGGRRRSPAASRRGLRPGARLARPTASSTRASRPRSARWRPATRWRPASPRRWPSTSCAAPCCQRRRRRGSTGRGDAIARSVAATRLLAAEAALVSGDPAGAVALAAGGLDHDPYDEAALRALMRGHVALGRPASALAAYATTRARVSEDLGVSLTADTEALHDGGAGRGAGAPAPPDPGRRAGAMGSARAASPCRAGRRRLRLRSARRRRGGASRARGPAPSRWRGGSRTTTATS